MNCKNCGGKLLHKEGKWICQSCGEPLVIDGIYENIDVYICYEENDDAGRRTKDSIISQEVYKKLEASKITAFYERISADGLAADALIAARYSAMQSAKTVVVLGSSIEHFHSIAEKYGALLEKKTVIPFCVDVAPNAIPKNISKIQAINYATIGWDADLVKGLCNLLGREENVNTGSLYGKSRKKSVVFSAVGAVVLLLILAVFVIFRGNRTKGQELAQSTEIIASTATTEAIQATTKPLTQKEIYEQVITLINEEQFVEALKLLVTIPEHPDSENKIQLIYAKYEGYYKNGNISLHLDVVDNARADIEVTVSGDPVIIFSTSEAIAVDSISGTYRDNHQQTGTFDLKLENAGLRFVYAVDESNQKTEKFFALAEKSDKPFVQIDAEILLDWLEKKISFSQLRSQGFEMNDVFSIDRAGDDRLYRINDTDIYLSMFSYGNSGKNKERILFGVQAPASIIAPSHIGKECMPFVEGNLIYWPNGFYAGGSFWAAEESSVEEKITADTLIGITSKKVLSEEEWEWVVSRLVEDKAETYAKKKYSLKTTDWVHAEIITENDTHMLLIVNTEKLRDAYKRAWYQFDKNSQKVSFVREGSWQESGYNAIAKDLWFSEYLDFAMEFPDLFGNYPGTTAWDEMIEGVLLEKAEKDVLDRYPQDADSWVVRETIAQNSKHFLICVQPMSLRNKHMCAWYRGNKADGSVSFVKEGPYATGGYQFSKVLWFKWYSDFAEEFPQLYSTFREAIAPYLTETPYAVSIDGGYYLNPYLPEPSYDPETGGYEYEYWLPAGVYVIVEEQYDERNYLWGRLESGEGWVCLTEIWEDSFWGYN